MSEHLYNGPLPQGPVTPAWFRITMHFWTLRRLFIFPALSADSSPETEVATDASYWSLVQQSIGALNYFQGSKRLSNLITIFKVQGFKNFSKLLTISILKISKPQFLNFQVLSISKFSESLYLLFVLSLNF